MALISKKQILIPVDLLEKLEAYCSLQKTLQRGYSRADFYKEAFTKILETPITKYHPSYNHEHDVDIKPINIPITKDNADLFKKAFKKANKEVSYRVSERRLLINAIMVLLKNKKINKLTSSKADTKTITTSKKATTGKTATASKTAATGKTATAAKGKKTKLTIVATKTRKVKEEAVELGLERKKANKTAKNQKTKPKEVMAKNKSSLKKEISKIAKTASKNPAMSAKNIATSKAAEQKSLKLKNTKLNKTSNRKAKADLNLVNNEVNAETETTE